MPEGDTIARSARSLHQWLAGRAITGARSGFRREVPGLDRLVGTIVTGVRPIGKHLLIDVDAGLTLRTHMRMTGSWHVYPAAAPWRRPARQMTLVLEAGDRVAVCFNVPVAEVEPTLEVATRGPVASLGPDVLADPIDLAEIRRRVAAVPPGRPVGELLLDQRIAAGIGNIWRCEALFATGVSPWTPVGELAEEHIDALVQAAARMMRASVSGVRPVASVYGRVGRPCRRCGATIRSRPQGPQARTASWCPSCQPGPDPSG